MAAWKKSIKKCEEFGLLENDWYMSMEAKMHRNAAVVLRSVKMLSTREFNHKLFKMYINLFSFCGVFCKIGPFFFPPKSVLFLEHFSKFRF